jgi:hypothetical protein
VDLPVLRARRRVVGRHHLDARQQADRVRLADDQVERLADADVDDHVGTERPDLQQLRQEIGRRPVEHDLLDLEAVPLLPVLLLGLIGEADAVIGRLGKDRHALEVVLLDPAHPGRHARRIDCMGAERDRVALVGDAAGAGLGAHRRHAHLLGDLVHRDVHPGMHEAEHGDRLLVGDQTPIGRHALLVLARAVMDREHGLAPEHPALDLVEILDADLAAAPHELSERGLTRRRQRHDRTEHDRILGLRNGRHHRRPRQHRRERGEQRPTKHGSPLCHCQRGRAPRSPPRRAPDE